jgi:hypothetical protein
MELQAFTGSPQAVFLDLFDSFEAVEKAGGDLARVNEAHPELVRLHAGISDTLARETTILAVRRDSPSLNTMNLAAARFLRMIVVRMRPGEEQPNLDQAGRAVYEVTSGMSVPAFLIFQPLTEFTALPPVAIAAGTIAEDAVYIIEPTMSHVSREFAAQDPAFWIRPLPAESPRQR